LSFNLPAKAKQAGQLDFICHLHLDFGIWNLLRPALSLSKGDYKELEVKYEDNT
jgi:hypothetical protein